MLDSRANEATGFGVGGSSLMAEVTTGEDCDMGISVVFNGLGLFGDRREGSGFGKV